MPYKNKDQQKAAQHAWYLAHKDLTQKRSKKWKKNNKQKVADGDREYRQRNRNQIRQKNNAYERKQTAELSDYYIRKELDKYGIPSSFSRQYPELIEATRQYYATIRLIIKMKKDAKKKGGVRGSNKLQQPDKSVKRQSKGAGRGQKRR